MYKKQNRQSPQNGKSSNERGVSIVEILVVVVLMSALAAISYAYLANQRTAYRSDQQATLMADIFQRARLTALNNRRTIRVEINLTTNLVRLIDEGTAGIDTDDRLVTTLTIPANIDVRVDRRPANIPSSPNGLTEAAFAASVYTAPSIGSSGQSVFTLRFLQNGTVTNGGTNSIAAGATITGATIYVWTPNSATDLTNTGRISGARAITILATGAVKLWYQIPASQVVGGIYWRDTR